jgi:hypothetical protein
LFYEQQTKHKCIASHLISPYFQWRTTRSPKDDEPKPQLLKRDFIAPASKREPSTSFNTDRAYVDFSDFGIKFGKRSYQMSPEDLGISFGKRSYQMNPEDIGISFGKRSVDTASNIYELDPSELATSFGKRSVNYQMNPEDIGISFGKRAAQSDNAFRWLRKRR